jgi:hypothetical protein
MQECGFIFSKVGQRGLHDRARRCQPGPAMSDDPMPLLSRGVEPTVQQLKILAAVIYLDVVHAGELPVAPGYQVLGDAVPDLCQIFGQVDGGIGIVTHPEQKNLAAHLVDTPDGTVQAMGNIQRVSRCDFLGPRAGGRKRMWAFTPENSRQAPERVGNNAHAEARRGMGLERMIIVIAHARHNQGTLRLQRREQGPYQPPRSTHQRRHF